MSECTTACRGYHTYGPECELMPKHEPLAVWPDEPKDGTVFRSHKPNPSWSPHKTDRPAEITALLWRDDWQADWDNPLRRWFSSFHGREESYMWSEIQPGVGETLVRLVPSPFGEILGDIQAGGE